MARPEQSKQAYHQKLKGVTWMNSSCLALRLKRLPLSGGLQAAIELQGDDFLAVEPTPTRMTATEWRVNYGNS